VRALPTTMLILTLLVALLQSLSHWLLETLVEGLTPLLQLKGVLPWLALGLGAWFLAGRSD
jgi:hypothetical protein